MISYLSTTPTHRVRSIRCNHPPCAASNIIGLAAMGGTTPTIVRIASWNIAPSPQCRAPHEACSCVICLRQPPSLRLWTLHTIRTLIFDMERFELTALTTYDEYVYAVRSGEASVSQIGPPEYPEIRVWYQHDFLADSIARFHKHCPGAGPWGTFTCSEFTTSAEAIETLIIHRQHFWCTFCNRGLFFPNFCEDDDHE